MHLSSLTPWLPVRPLSQVRAVAVRQPATDGSTGPPRVLLVTDEHRSAPTPAELAGFAGPSPGVAKVNRPGGVLKAGEFPNGVDGALAFEGGQGARGTALAGAAGEESQGAAAGPARLPETLTHWKALQLPLPYLSTPTALLRHPSPTVHRFSQRQRLRANASASPSPTRPCTVDGKRRSGGKDHFHFSPPRGAGAQGARLPFDHKFTIPVDRFHGRGVKKRRDTPRFWRPDERGASVGCPASREFLAQRHRRG